MTMIAAGNLDSRNCGAVVRFIDSEGYTVVTTLDGITIKGGLVELWTPIAEEPYEIETSRMLDVYLAPNARYSEQSMKTLDVMVEELVTLTSIFRAVLAAPKVTMPHEEVEPMEVPC